jgi:hypothetical protein
MSITVSETAQDPGTLGAATSDQKAGTNPFNTPFDNEDEEDDDEDEWWDEDVARSITKKDETPINKDDVINSARLTQWPGAELNSQPTPHPVRANTRKVVSKRSSVQRPKREASKGRQRKQNAKAGIKIITDLPPRHKRPAHAVQQPTMSTLQPSQASHVGMFVDLATLQSLNTDAPSSSQGFWKSMKGILPGNSASGTEAAPKIEAGLSEETNIPTGIASRRGHGLAPTPIKLESDLSPFDRPIVIGISIPSARLAHHVTSPQTAASETSDIIRSYGTQSPLDVPETPTIIITPAQNHSAWDPLAGGSNSHRPSSSMYSRATNHSGRYDKAGVPPVPQLHPTSPGQNKNAGRESVGTIFAEDDELQPASPNASRVMSSCTIFEEDTPIAPQSALSPNDAVTPRQVTVHSIGEHRMSKGWWNLITTPFLTRSNTLASPNTAVQEDQPALPSLETAALKAQVSGLGLQTWDKTFSPITPETSTTIASDAWWDKRNTMDGGPKNAESENNTYSSTNQNEWDTQSGTLPFMLFAGEATMRAARLSIPTNGMDKFGSSNVERGLSTKSILSPSDREAPVMLDDSLPTVSHTSAAPAQLGVENITHSTSRTRRPLSELVIQAVAAEHAAALSRSPGESIRSVQPPPYSPPRRHLIKMRPIFPPGHQSNFQPPHSPAPPSPGLQQAMGATGAIPMAEIPLTPQLPRRPINLNSGYPSLPLNQGAWPLAPSKKAVKAEKKRIRHEKEDRLAHKAGGFWRGRGCIPERGCYGRTGPEGRKRRRWYFGICTAFFSVVIIISVVLVTQLHRNPATPTQMPSQWVNLTGFPPMFTGISTVISPENTVSVSACAFPSTIWSCALPKELQKSGFQANQPNFRLNIKWDNSSNANVSGNTLATRSVGGNVVSVRHAIKRLGLIARDFTITPLPTPPTLAEQWFLGNTSDGVVSADKDGETTPFYVSFMDPTSGKPSFAHHFTFFTY